MAHTSLPSQSSAQDGNIDLRGIGLASVLIALMLTLLLEALDSTIVGVALPHIIGSLQGFDSYTWVVTTYLLASVTAIPIVGKLSDQFGRKGFLIAGTAIFLLGSVLSGASQTMGQLIVFRTLQGLGAGIGIALVNTVVGDIFPPAQRAKWQAILGGVYSISSIVGPGLGGWLTDQGPLLGALVTETTRWRWIFYINLPVGVLALVALIIYLPKNISVRSSTATGWAALRRVDGLGAVLAAAATICLLLGLTWGSSQAFAWNSPQVIGILVGAAILSLFFVQSQRFAVEPLLPLSLFRNQVFSADAALSLLQAMITTGLALSLPLLFQAARDVSAANAGVLMTPFEVSAVLGAAMSGAAIAFSKRYHIVTILGTLVITIGVFLLTQISASTGLPAIAIFTAIAGMGLGSLFPVLTLVAQNALPRTHLGVGTGAINYLRQMGYTLGAAMAGAVVNTTLAYEIPRHLSATVAQQLTPEGVKLAANPQVLVNPLYHDTVIKSVEKIVSTTVVPFVPQLLNQTFEALKLSLSVAIQHSFVLILILCGISVVATLFLKDVPMEQRSSSEEVSITDTTTSNVEENSLV